MNIYVSNLDFKVEDQDLKQFFTPFGEVASAKIITDRESNRSRGFGFVEMPNEPEGKNAINNLNGSMVEGRPISVNLARPKVNSDGSNKDFKKNFWK